MDRALRGHSHLRHANAHRRLVSRCEFSCSQDGSSPSTAPDFDLPQSLFRAGTGCGRNRALRHPGRRLAALRAASYRFQTSLSSADKYRFSMHVVLKCVLLALVFSAAVYDLRFRRIPNWLNLAGIAAGLLANLWLSGWHGFTASLLGLSVSLLVYIPLYLLRAMGAGDVKLMAAVGSIVGPGNWIEIFLATAILGGIVALLLVAWKKRFHQTVLNLAIIIAELLHFREPARRDLRLDVRHSGALRLPYGAVIACGSIAFLIILGTRWLPS